MKNASFGLRKKMNLDEVMEYYILYCENRNLSKHTIKKYIVTFKKIYKFLEGKISCDDFTTKTIEEYVSQCIKNRAKNFINKCRYNYIKYVL